MTNINFTVNHLTACREAVVEFSKENNIKIMSSKIRIGTADYKKAEDLLNHKSVVCVSFEKEGNILDANLCTDWNWSNMNYFTIITGCFEAKLEKWTTMPIPSFVEFHALEEVGDKCLMKKHLQALKDRILTIKEKQPGQKRYTSVAALFRSIKMGDLYKHFPWLEHTHHAKVIESWKLAMETLPMTTIASTEGYYISIDSLELKNKAIGLNETIKHYEKKEVSLSFDQCKDLSFISKLPVYMDARLDPASVVLNMIMRLSNLKPEIDENERVS